MTRFNLPAAVLLGALSCGSAFAQDEPSEPAKRQVLITKLFEANKKESWKEVS